MSRLLVSCALVLWSSAVFAQSPGQFDLPVLGVSVAGLGAATPGSYKLVRLSREGSIERVALGPGLEIEVRSSRDRCFLHLLTNRKRFPKLVETKLPSVGVVRFDASAGKPAAWMCIDAGQGGSIVALAFGRRVTQARARGIAQAMRAAIDSGRRARTPVRSVVSASTIAGLETKFRYQNLEFDLGRLSELWVAEKYGVRRVAPSVGNWSFSLRPLSLADMQSCESLATSSLKLRFSAVRFRRSSALIVACLPSRGAAGGFEMTIRGYRLQPAALAPIVEATQRAVGRGGASAVLESQAAKPLSTPATYPERAKQQFIQACTRVRKPLRSQSYCQCVLDYLQKRLRFSAVINSEFELVKNTHKAAQHECFRVELKKNTPSIRD